MRVGQRVHDVKSCQLRNKFGLQASAVATMRSPRAGRVAKGTSPRVGGKPASKVFSAVALDSQFCHLLVPLLPYA